MTRRIARHQPSTRREPTIALINVVFLMLVFFLVAGSFAPAFDQNLSLVKTQDLDPSQTAKALVIHADRSLSYDGNVLNSVADIARDYQSDPLYVIPDKDLSATAFLAKTNALKSAGVQRIIIMTEAALP